MQNSCGLDAQFYTKYSTIDEECFALGFQMDCGKAFIETYPVGRAFNAYKELNRIIDDITDTLLLGSAIFSK